MRLSNTPVQRAPSRSTKLKSNSKIKLSVMGALLSIAIAQVAVADVFINEFHYDNSGGDVGEAIEVAGNAGTDLSGWSVVFTTVIILKAIVQPIYLVHYLISRMVLAP